MTCTNTSKLNRLKCRMQGINNGHFPKDPRQLPCCGKMSCLKCVQETLDYFGNFNCPYCKSRIFIKQSRSELSQLFFVQNEISQNSKAINIESVSKLKDSVLKLKGKSPILFLGNKSL